MRVSLYGPVYDLTGYGETARQLAFALEDEGTDVRVVPQNWSYTKADLTLEARQRIKELTEKDRKNRDDIIVNVPLFFKKQDNTFTMGLTMSEVHRLTEKWAACCNSIDTVLVPSLFNRQTFIASGVAEEKIQVLPLGVDTALFCPEGSRYWPPGADLPFTFLSVGEWLPRKGFDLLITAFVQEFSKDEKVRLVLRCHSNSSDYDPKGKVIYQQIKNLVKRQKKDTAPEILLLGEALPAVNLAALYRSVHCFVQATRGEGWNMPVFEALAAGVPVITTNWSAHTEHLNEENAFLVNIEGLETIPCYGYALDEVYGGHKWARPSVAHLRRQMRYVYEHYQEAKIKARRGREMVLGRLRWRDCARKLMQLYRSIDRCLWHK